MANHAIKTAIPPQEAKRILVIEDDPDIAELICLHLRDRYATVEQANDGLSGYRMATDSNWDLILLDLRLPGMEGLDICRQLRATANYVPIVMLTSKSTELDQVLGLEMGADDYVTKPFSVMELMSRVKAVLRRVELAKPGPASSSILASGGIELHTGSREVRVDGSVVELTAKEFELLSHFLKYPGEVFSRAQLLDLIWGYGHEGYEHTVNSHINRLRAKIEATPTQPTRLTTIWGVGYKLNVTENRP